VSKVLQGLFAVNCRPVSEVEESYVNSLKDGFLLNDTCNSARISQKTHHVSATKPNRLTLFRENIAVYCENRMKHTSTLCVQNAEF
jgi:hypothetical protein